jgi:RHS repeat-associated protein
VQREQTSTSETVRTLLQDNLSSTARIVDNASMSVTALRYGVWGEGRTQAVNTAPTDLLYTGQEKSANVGFYDYNARWYDPATGRFLQPDSMLSDLYDPVQLDRYAYVGNNPIVKNDPTGHCGESPYTGTPIGQCAMQGGGGGGIGGGMNPYNPGED